LSNWLARQDSIFKSPSGRPLWHVLGIPDYLHRTYLNPAALTGRQHSDYKGDVMNDLHGVYQVDNEGRFILQNLMIHGQVVPSPS
jgi:hypothetical protein